MSSRAIAHPLVSGALNAKRPWAIGRDFTVLVGKTSCSDETIAPLPQPVVQLYNTMATCRAMSCEL